MKITLEKQLSRHVNKRKWRPENVSKEGPSLKRQKCVQDWEKNLLAIDYLEHHGQLNLSKSLIYTYHIKIPPGCRPWGYAKFMLWIEKCQDAERSYVWKQKLPSLERVKFREREYPTLNTYCLGKDHWRIQSSFSVAIKYYLDQALTNFYFSLLPPNPVNQHPIIGTEIHYVWRTNKRERRKLGNKDRVEVQTLISPETLTRLCVFAFPARWLGKLKTKANFRILRQYHQEEISMRARSKILSQK